jgi:HEAT repeat protein
MKKLLVLGLALALAGCQQEKVHKGKRVSAWVVQLREGTWPADRWRAALALGEIGHEARGAIPDLIEALEDHDHLVRWAAAGALGNFGPEARPALDALRRVAAKDPNRAVRRAARAARRKIEREG